MKLLSLIIAASIATSTTAIAEDLTFVIPGGTKGVFMAQAVSHTEDLARLGYTVDIGAPGNTCGAAELINNLDHPTLFIWGSDYDASAKMGDGCAAPAFAAEEVVAVSYNPVFVCVMDPTIDPLSGDHRLGIWQAVEALQTDAVRRLNTLSGSNLTPIPYDGSGSALTALTNGEVDVALLPRGRATTVKESGGKCEYMFSNADQDAGTKSLVEVYSDPELNLTSMDVIVVKNWDVVEAQARLTEIYADSTSSVSNNPAKFNDSVPADVVTLWNNAVEAFVTE